MKLGKWRSVNAPVRVSRKKKADFDIAIQDLLKRGYKVTWQHETLNFAVLKRNG